MGATQFWWDSKFIYLLQQLAVHHQCRPRAMAPQYGCQRARYITWKASVVVYSSACSEPFELSNWGSHYRAIRPPGIICSPIPPPSVSLAHFTLRGLKRLLLSTRPCGGTCFIQHNCYFSRAVIAIVASSQGFCECMWVICKRVCVCVRVCLLVKDDSTIFCKKADRRVAVAIVTEQPGFLSCSSEDFLSLALVYLRPSLGSCLAATPKASMISCALSH